MPMTILDPDNGITKVILSGRIDIASAQEIDLPMAVIGGSRKAVIIDLSGVSFMASMGLRSLLSCAKTVQRKGGKIGLVVPPGDVADVITTMGVNEVIPVHETEALAVDAVLPC